MYYSWGVLHVGDVDPAILEACDVILSAYGVKRGKAPKDFDPLTILALVQTVIMLVQYCKKKDGAALKDVLDRRNFLSKWLVKRTIRKHLAEQMTKTGRDPWGTDREMLDDFVDSAYDAALDATPEQLDLLVKGVAMSEGVDVTLVPKSRIRKSQIDDGTAIA